MQLQGASARRGTRRRGRAQELPGPRSKAARSTVHQPTWQGQARARQVAAASVAPGDGRMAVSIPSAVRVGDWKTRPAAASDALSATLMTHGVASPGVAGARRWSTRSSVACTRATSSWRSGIDRTRPSAPTIVRTVRPDAPAAIRNSRTSAYENDCAVFAAAASADCSGAVPSRTPARWRTRSGSMVIQVVPSAPWTATGASSAAGVPERPRIAARRRARLGCEARCSTEADHLPGHSTQARTASSGPTPAPRGPRTVQQRGDRSRSRAPGASACAGPASPAARVARATPAGSSALATAAEARVSQTR